MIITGSKDGIIQEIDLKTMKKKKILNTNLMILDVK
jgi:hypothetical protein